jgi:hypothetical protein
MEALASIHLFNLDDPALAPAHRIDGMHAKPAAGNEPRHHDLSHWVSTPEERLSKPFVVVMLRLSSYRISQSRKLLTAFASGLETCEPRQAGTAGRLCRSRGCWPTEVLFGMARETATQMTSSASEALAKLSTCQGRQRGTGPREASQWPAAVAYRGLDLTKLPPQLCQIEQTGRLAVGTLHPQRMEVRHGADSPGRLPRGS